MLHVSSGQVLGGAEALAAVSASLQLKTFSIWILDWRVGLSWNVLATFSGSFRECFSTGFKLGRPEAPIRVTRSCELQRTQGDPASTIRACICTSNFCNDVNNNNNNRFVSPGNNNSGSTARPSSSTTRRATTVTTATTITSTTTTAFFWDQRVLKIFYSIHRGCRRLRS